MYTPTWATAQRCVLTHMCFWPVSLAMIKRVRVDFCFKVASRLWGVAQFLTARPAPGEETGHIWNEEEGKQSPQQKHSSVGGSRGSACAGGPVRAGLVCLPVRLAGSGQATSVRGHSCPSRFLLLGTQTSSQSVHECEAPIIKLRGHGDGTIRLLCKGSGAALLACGNSQGADPGARLFPLLILLTAPVYHDGSPRVCQPVPLLSLGRDQDARDMVGGGYRAS